MLLTLIVFTPLVGAVAMLFLPKDRTALIRRVAVTTALFVLACSCVMWRDYDVTDPGLQFVEQYSWIPALNIQYFVAVDGLSIAMVVLTALLSVLAIVASFSIKERLKEYMFFFLLLETGMLGVFVALDFFLFYVFWEVTLVPMYFLIGIWGGPRKDYAAIKFFLYTLFGSLIMLLGILALYLHTDPHTFNMVEIAKNVSLPPAWRLWVYLALYIGFAVKIPVFPFHTWLPDAHVEAPTGVSVILAGVLLKMGLYGILRVSYTILPQEAMALSWWLALFAVINIVYGAFVAMAQTDLKRMVAYSSVNHMGYAMLGMAAMNATGLQGCILQMVTHGLITGALFFLVGVIYDRAHTREIGAFGGLRKNMPVYFGFMSLAALASLGLPSLAGFVGELLCFIGAFQVPELRWMVMVSMVGVVVTATFFLTLLLKVFLGPLNEKWAGLPDMTWQERLCVIPLAVLMIVVGVYPQLVLGTMTATVQQLVDVFRALG